MIYQVFQVVVRSSIVSVSFLFLLQVHMFIVNLQIAPMWWVFLKDQCRKFLIHWHFKLIVLYVLVVGLFFIFIL